MSLGDFLRKQFVDVIQWTEAGEGVLAWRVPMPDMEIQYGGQLTVRESQMALFVNEGKAADLFGPGLHTLETRTLPLLTNLQHWDKAFQSPFKSDVYFFSTRLQTGQHWGTAQPVTVRDKEFGAVRLRAFGTYAYVIANPALFHLKVSGTRDVYTVADLEPHLRALIVSGMSEALGKSPVPFLDMAGNLGATSAGLRDALAPAFDALGLKLDTFVIESLSLPDELQKRLDERIGMGMVGDLSQYTKFQVAQSIPLAAANEGGIAGAGAGLGAGLAMAGAFREAMQPPAAGGQGQGGGSSGSAAPDAAAAGETKFCLECGKAIAKRAKFCPECGATQ